MPFASCCQCAPSRKRLLNCFMTSAWSTAKPQEHDYFWQIHLSQQGYCYRHVCIGNIARCLLSARAAAICNARHIESDCPTHQWADQSHCFWLPQRACFQQAMVQDPLAVATATHDIAREGLNSHCTVFCLMQAVFNQSHLMQTPTCNFQAICSRGCQVECYEASHS